MSLYYIVAAVTGFLTLGIEMVAGRLLAPYLGSSLHQWAALIGVVLLAYMAGYSVVQRLTRFGAAPVLFAAGLYVLLFPVWGFLVLELLLNWPLALASIASSLVVAGVPSFLWAALLPYFQEKAGKKGSARVLAWGSAGNLLGAWTIAFLAVPGIGTRLTWLGLGAASLALGVILFTLERRKMARALAVALAMGIGGGSWALAHYTLPSATVREGLDAESTLVADTESPYQRIRVWDRDYSGRPFRMLGLNHTVQFFWDRGDAWVQGEPYMYYNWSALLAGLNSGRGPTFESGLFLGVGGGLVPWQIRKLFEGTADASVPMPRMVGLELDAAVARVAKQYLPLGDAGPIDVQIGDARQLMRRLDEKFDYILADTFLNSYVPFHLTTKEFFELASQHLTDEGVLVVNLHTVFSLTGLLDEIESTIASVFPNVMAIDIEAGTTLVVASRSTAPLTERLRAAANKPGLDPQMQGEYGAMAARGRMVRQEVGDAVLTDDLNDTEQRLYETRRFLVMKRGI